MNLKELLSAISEKKRSEAIWLLSSILNISKAEIFLQQDRVLDSKQEKQIKNALSRRKNGEPLQYIVKSAPFFGREFFVEPGVLIPRPETEQLVDFALGLFPEREKISVLDLCTGSGVVGITLQLERSNWRVVATDISDKPLDISRKNASALGATVRFKKADGFTRELQREKWDLVISNPPYLNFKKDRITKEVKDWEPRLALEPQMKQRVSGLKERASWLAERILVASSINLPRYTLLELSPRVALLLEKRWRKNPAVQHISRKADLAGRKRFLLVAWNHG